MGGVRITRTGTGDSVVGAIVGKSTRLYVCLMVGSSVSIFKELVGTSVGYAVGLVVGLDVGLTVGFAEGFFVGLAVGFDEGLVVGFAVGLLVGSNASKADGGTSSCDAPYVGTAVGLVVGRGRLIAVTVGSPVIIGFLVEGLAVGLNDGLAVGLELSLVVGSVVG